MKLILKMNLLTSVMIFESDLSSDESDPGIETPASNQDSDTESDQSNTDMKENALDRKST